MNILRIISCVLILLGLLYIHPSEDVIQQEQLNENKTKHYSTIGILSIPSLDLQEAVVEGSDTAALDIGIGHIPSTTSNIVLSAHRATYFKHLDKLRIQDKVYFQDIDFKTHTYIVYDIFKVDPKDVWVIDQREEDILTLITCTDNNMKRLIIKARKEDIHND